MTHFDQQTWIQYIEATLSPNELEKMELHLYQCDLCLSVFMVCMEHVSHDLPHSETDEHTYMDSIMKRTVRTKPAWHRSIWFHYGVAAAATLILVVSGFFHGLSEDLISIHALKPTESLITWNENAPSSAEQKTAPLSDRLLNQTLTWLDALQNK